MSTLSEKNCVPCQGGIPPLSPEEVKSYLPQLERWRVIDNHHLEKEYEFKNFKDALFHTNQIGNLAETEGHHPDIFLSWGKVIVKIWTHKINGLHENDFIFAAKCDQVSRPNPVL